MLILASNSKPREDLLKQLGVYCYPQSIDFNESYYVEAANYTDNNTKCDKCPEKLVDDFTVERAFNALNLSKQKFPSPGDYVVLGSVTKLYDPVTNKFLETPLLIGYKSPETLKQITDQARELLLSLKGKKIEVYTSCCFITAGDSMKGPEMLKKEGKLVCCKTVLHFRNFQDREIEKYLESAEAFNKSGGFAIQNRGSLLLDKIEGSYSGAIGLPLYEFLNYFSTHSAGLDIAKCITKPLTVYNNVEGYELAITTMGDINYDYVYQFASDFKFCDLGPKRYQEIGEIPNSIGGTGTNFALAARQAGFYPSYLFGRVGDDPLGDIIRSELEKGGVDTTCIIKDSNSQTSKSLLLRYSSNGKDGYLTITDQKQSWDNKNFQKLESIFSSSTVLYVSGYCIIDPRRYNVTRNAMENAKLNFNEKSNKIVVLELVVEFIIEFEKQSDEFKKDFTWINEKKSLRFETFVSEMLMKDNKCLVDILVAESKTINSLFNDTVFSEDLTYNDSNYIDLLKEKFKVIIIRNADTTKELIIIRNKNVLLPKNLQHQNFPAVLKKGYRAKRLAHIIYAFLGPRIGLITENSEKVEILEKVITKNNIFPIKINHEVSCNTFLQDSDTALIAVTQDKITNNLSNIYPATVKVIVSAHSIILYNGEYIPRPYDENSIRNFLYNVKGNTFIVKTCVSVLGVKGRHKDTIKSYITENKLKMQDLSLNIIDAFVKSGEWKDSLLGFSLLRRGEAFIKSIDGSFTSCAGLSIESLYKILNEDFGIDCWDLDNVNNWELDDDLIDDENIF